MRIRRLYALVTLAGPLSAAAACSGTHDEDDTATGGATGYTGGAGTALGGSPASGGAAVGGSPAAGGTTAGTGTAVGGTAPATAGAASGGGSSTGGSSGADLDSQIAAACSNRQANGFVLGCTGVFGDAYLNSCQANLQAAAQTCPAEVQALLDCSRSLSVLEYACDANNEVGFASGVCTTESAAVDQCVS